MKTKIIKIDSSTVISKAITQAVRVIQNGGVIAFPTETVYGLAADAGNEDAIQRIFDLKRRPANKPILILISDKTQITEFVAKVSSIADRLMKKYWPGPLTIVFPAKSSVSSILRGGGDTIGIRIPSHPVAQALLQACICPLTAPSANISATKNPLTVQDVLDQFDGEIDMILDAGMSPSKVPSTVIDVTKKPPRILRSGAISVSSEFLS